MRVELEMTNWGSLGGKKSLEECLVATGKKEQRGW